MSVAEHRRLAQAGIASNKAEKDLWFPWTEIDGCEIGCMSKMTFGCMSKMKHTCLR